VRPRSQELSSELKIKGEKTICEFLLPGLQALWVPQLFRS
jgi:hypothetical protein